MTTTGLQNNQSKQNLMGINSWQPQRAMTLDAARRHSAFVKGGRRVLLISAASLIGVLGWYFVNAPDTLTPTASASESVKMVNPIYKGRTLDGLGYRIAANEAVRTTQNPDELKLANPILSFSRVRGVQDSVVHADIGIYNHKKQVLELQDHVRLNTDDGYLCNTAQSRVYVKGKRIEGESAIECKGVFGTTSGNAYEITDKYSQLILKKGMKAQFVPEDSQHDLRGTATVKATLADAANGNLQTEFGTHNPVDVIADRATYKGEKITLTGNVIVRQDDVRIEANRMDLFRKKIGKTETGDTKYGDVNRIEAIGGFKYSNAEDKLAGDKGVYERDKHTITVTGKVSYTQAKGSSISGCRLVYDLETSRAKFDGGCVNTQQETGRIVIKTGQ